MGTINCAREVDSQMPIYPQGKIKMDEYFNEVPVLNQTDYDKWAEPVFSFKILRDGKWYLGTFYKESETNEVGLAFSEFVE